LLYFVKPDETALQDLWDYIAAARPAVESALERHRPVAPAGVPTRFNEAARYALFPGGKRLRPVLTLLAAELAGGAAARVMPAAVAVEFIHTASLIFDDLPCMDNAAERRGKLSLHAEFGEGLAILVALSLLNASYGLVFQCETDAATGARAHRELVAGIGANGMVAGQSLDLAEIALPVASAAQFESWRNLKTSALMLMALRVGAVLAGADDAQLAAVSRYAARLGDAYQISDDLLDLNEDAALAIHAARPATLAHAHGAAAAKKRVNTLAGEAKAALRQEFGDARPARLLGALADYVAARSQ
jgi:geranylgeranyl diphosphate synthase type II